MKSEWKAATNKKKRRCEAKQISDISAALKVYAFLWNWCSILFGSVLFSKTKRKKVERWKKERELIQQEEMAVVGDRVIREMQYENALNCSIHVSMKHQKVTLKGALAPGLAHIWAVDKNEVTVWGISMS